MSYPVSVPDTKTSTGYETSDPDVKIIADAYNLPENFVENVRMVHYVPWTKYTAKRESSQQVFDKFIMWTVQGELSEEQLKAIQTNPYYINYWYDKDPIEWTTIWFEVQDGLENKITIYPENENS